MSIIAIQNTTAYTNGTDEQRSDLIKTYLVSCAFNQVGYREEWYESDADLELIKKDLTAAAVDVVDRANEVFPLPYDASVTYVAEALFKRHLLFSSTDSPARLKAIACLMGNAAPDLNNTTPTV